MLSLGISAMATKPQRSGAVGGKELIICGAAAVPHHILLIGHKNYVSLLLRTSGAGEVV